MKLVTGKILGEELKKKGVEVAEEVLHEIEVTLFVDALPRVAVEATEPLEKGAAGLLLSMYPVLKPQLEKLEDLNADGSIGVK